MTCTVVPRSSRKLLNVSGVIPERIGIDVLDGFSDLGGGRARKSDHEIAPDVPDPKLVAGLHELKVHRATLVPPRTAGIDVPAPHLRGHTPPVLPASALAFSFARKM